MNQQVEKLKLIREEAVANAYEAGKVMTERENKKTNPLKINTGDFVYMLKEAVGPGKKLQPKYSGPYVIHEILSPHLVKLREKDSGKLFKNPVNLDRLKMAFVRAPNPANYFIPECVKNEAALEEVVNRQNSDTNKADNSAPELSTTQSEEPLSEPYVINNQPNVTNDQPHVTSDRPDITNNQRTRPVRQIRKPLRYRSGLDTVSETDIADSSSFEQSDNKLYKINAFWLNADGMKSGNI